nr:NYN domain-containing protein [bacterium]
MSTPFVRISIYYDGAHFFRASNHYLRDDPQASRIDIQGMQRYILREVARRMEVDAAHCTVIDTHFYRNRIMGETKPPENVLKSQQEFADVLLHMNIELHDIVQPEAGRMPVRMMEMCMALDAMERMGEHPPEVMVLIGDDPLYIPMVKRLQAKGTRVLLLYWDAAMRQRERFTPCVLASQAHWYVEMDDAIEHMKSTGDGLMESFFLPPRPLREDDAYQGYGEDDDDEDDAAPRSFFSRLFNRGEEREEEPHSDEVVNPDGTRESTILSLHAGYGFIRESPRNRFFHQSALKDCNWYDLTVGARVRYRPVSTVDDRQQAEQVELIKD